MEPQDTPHHLSRITTQWTLVFEAHREQQTVAMQAQQALMHRYCGAIYRYLVSAVRDPDAADDLSQEFALRLVRGDFKRADPGQGRFRDFLKSSLYHLVIDYHRRKARRRHEFLDPDAPAPADGDSGLPSDQEFLARWREELLDRAWEALATVEKETGKPFFSVLRFRAENPKLPSGEIAQKLQERLGKPLTDVGVRQTLHRAREKFADLLLEEVAHSLETSDVERLSQELIDLDLLPYCRTALDRFTGKA
jgi:RNA polymerase sigma-70 factor (ECF subfamily)